MDQNNNHQPLEGDHVWSEDDNPAGDDETQLLAEWQAFLLACPAENRLDLNQTHVATAFHRARLRGWTVDELADSVTATYKRVPNGGGLVVTRLRGLADTIKPDEGGGPCGYGCQRGWLPDLPDGRAVPCPSCKPHLTRCSDCQVWRVKGINHACRAVKKPKVPALAWD